MILDDDEALPELGIGDVRIVEGDAGTVNAAFTVSLSTVSSQTVTVVLQTANGTATTGSDYAAVGPITVTVTFPAGTVSRTVAIPVIGDTALEPDETFAVNLTAATNAGIVRAQGVGTILDDDTPVFPGVTPTISIDDVVVVEGNAGTTNATFTARLDRASTQSVTVTAQTANGTATAGSDYTPVGPINLQFSPGTTTQTLTVPVLGDTTLEPDETFAVNLSAPGNATIGDGQGLGTIRNDDGATPPGPGPGPAPAPSPNNDDEEDKPRVETEDERRNRERTNRAGKDDEYVEGNVVEVHPDERPPYVVIANRDGLVKVVLFKDASQVADDIRVGDYLEADGEKQHEQLFHADSVEISRPGR